MSDSIQVAIKVRPLIKREYEENLKAQWEIQDNLIFSLNNEIRKRNENGFIFDHVFGPEKNNIQIFNAVVKPVVEAAVNGFNGTVFAYGQTSSGKTHTMIGTDIEPGIVPLAIENIFEAIAKTHGREFLLRVSYFEIYNEKVNDLLNVYNQDLRLFEDTNGFVSVLKSTEEVANNPDSILEIMKRGDINRRMGETDMNERSSRSHTIFRVTIESRRVSSNSDRSVQVSQLNLVDLAGSERATQSSASGERFKEGTQINLSLSTLGLVIKQLSESTESKKNYINFRDSKLTRLLQASLGGNAMTVMIITVTPAAIEETQCTLSFASRAKCVKNKPRLNEVMSDATLLKRYEKQLHQLTAELENIKKKKSRSNEVDVIKTKLQEKENKLKEETKTKNLLEKRIELFKNIILSGTFCNETETNLKKANFQRRKTWTGGKDSYSAISSDSQNVLTTQNSNNLFPDISNKKSQSTNDDCSSALTPRKCYFQSPKCNTQSVDLKQSFMETIFTDLKLDLRENSNAKMQNELNNFEMNKKKFHSKPRVKFQDKVEIFQLSPEGCESITKKNDSLIKQGINKKFDELESPESIILKLQERIHELSEDYRILQEFTTLEKQCFINEQSQSMLHKKKFEELVHEIKNYKVCQNSSLISIMNTLVSLLPKIFNSWRPINYSYCDSEQDDIIKDLEKLQELFIALKIEGNTNSTKQMSEVEKKLSEELKSVKNEKEKLLQENTGLKLKLAEKSEKLKNNQIVINKSLVRDLSKKNNELSKLTEEISKMKSLKEKLSNEIKLLHKNEKVEKETQTSLDQVEVLENKELVCDISGYVINEENFVKPLFASLKTLQNQFHDRSKISMINKIIFQVKSLLDELQINNSLNDISIDEKLLSSQNCSKDSDFKLELESSCIFTNENYSYLHVNVNTECEKKFDQTCKVTDFSFNANKDFEENIENSDNLNISPSFETFSESLYLVSINNSDFENKNAAELNSQDLNKTEKSFETFNNSSFFESIIESEFENEDFSDKLNPEKLTSEIENSQEDSYLGLIMFEKPEIESSHGNSARKKKIKDLNDSSFKKPFKYGFKRELVIRKKKDNADVYYYTPKGKNKLRSLNDVSKYVDGNKLCKKKKLKKNHFLFARKLIGINDLQKEWCRGAQ